ncbi:phosphotransferase family protein [Mycobacterium sp. TY815]|uniref:phosphotransferase family protein n=1 Tax=Mycobacterium sp. TY815 TaxID=3050581 RepID=UPI0027405CEB|nr:phosphotransferase family protein [Mycobacterium sp. TY815]MDP7705159.1 phosphotransferase family protein [Mycobacterium sp. TY815]
MTWEWSPDELSRLGKFLAERAGCGPRVNARAVGDGHSNLTYVVSDGDRTVVVRRPPPPPVPVGAHDVVREVRLLTALAATPVPVPRVLAVAEPGQIVDVPLVVTEFIDAVVITESTPEPLNYPAARGQIAESVIDALADLHAVDWAGIGLGDFGKPQGFNSRHLRRVRALIERDGRLPDGFARLADWLVHHTPAESGAAIVHNDFRLGNMMIRPTPPGRVAAVLDWELATIGDPLFDLGYFLSSYPAPGEALTPTAGMGVAVLEEGYPSRVELLARYSERTGTLPRNIEWYSAMAQFKLAALYEYGRRRAETPSGDPYFADPALVAAFLRAGETCAGLSAHPQPA